MNMKIKPFLKHRLQEDEILTKLKEAIDVRRLSTHRINELILDLARHLDENEGYETQSN